MERLYEQIKTQPISDTHEHIISSTTLSKHRRGLIEFIGESYLQDDIISAGGSHSLFGAGSDEDRWRNLKPYLENCHNTTYYRCLIEALNDLFDLNEKNIDEGNWQEFNRLLLEKALQGASWYEHVLNKKAHIVHCMLDQDRTTDTEVGLWSEKGLSNVRDNDFEPQFFRRVARTDVLLNIVDAQPRMEIEKLYQLSLNGIDSIDALTARFIEKAKRENAVAIKSVAAYFRTLSFKNVKRDEAARAYRDLLKQTGTEADRLTVQNYMLHRLISKAGEVEIPFQFHTGMQAANENMLNNANPLKLNPVFIQYPQVRFVMLHGGYPFSAEAGVIAKKFPNVYLDCSWLPQISFAASVRSMDEWLDLVPMSKITWGGDCRHVENVYSAVLLFRKLMAKVLENKITSGMLDMATAQEIVKKVFFENAVNIFRL